MQTRTNLTVSSKTPENGGHCICASETHYIYARMTERGNNRSKYKILTALRPGLYLLPYFINYVFFRPVNHYLTETLYNRIGYIIIISLPCIYNRYCESFAHSAQNFLIAVKARCKYK